MIEYDVRSLETGDTAALVNVCNAHAKEGWRLVSTAAANAGGITVRVYLFFERQVEARDRLEDAVATMDAGERRELMDVAVAQTDAERPRQPVAE